MSKTDVFETLELTDRHYVSAVVSNASSAQEELSDSATPVFQRVLGSFHTAVVLPIAVAAAFCAPTTGPDFYRTVVRSKTTGSVIDLEQWDEDLWIFTTEPAILAEIQALNELLALPAREGFSVDLDSE